MSNKPLMKMTDKFDILLNSLTVQIHIVWLQMFAPK